MTFKGSGRTFCSYPIGVGIALSDGSHYEALIKPHHNWTSWCTQEESDHGISREYLEKHGKDISIICMELNNLCKGKHLCNDDYIWTGHWLNKLYSETGMRPSFTCFPIEYVVDRETLRDWNLRKNCSILEHQAHLDVAARYAAGDNESRLPEQVSTVATAENKTASKHTASKSALHDAFLISNILHKLDMTTINAHRNI